jgi:hypothetical protein
LEIYIKVPCTSNTIKNKKALARKQHSAPPAGVGAHQRQSASLPAISRYINTSSFCQVASSYFLAFSASPKYFCFIKNLVSQVKAATSFTNRNEIVEAEIAIFHSIKGSKDQIQKQFIEFMQNQFMDFQVN